VTLVLTVVGARPQFVKSAVVSRALAGARIRERIIHTGQHYDAAMSDVFFSELGIPAPVHHLGVGSGPHGMQTAAMLSGIERVLAEERPDWLLVYGDTNSTLAGAIAAAKVHVPIAHVEAGLRSFNRRMPEEVNRVATDHLSSMLLCPTRTAVSNLHAEGVVDAPERHGFRRRVRLVGDVMFDATRIFGEVAAERSTILATFGLAAGEYLLATIHRAENTDDGARLGAIADALIVLAREHKVIWPLHPRTRRLLDSCDVGRRLAESDVVLREPVGYLDMLMLEKGARCILTDSGGVQKEAFFAGVPCVTVRDETEWVELVELGWNQLASPAAGADAIVRAIRSAAAGRRDQHPYGHGDAAQLIAAELGG
jgi:UDP-GlcNAc3NAcA epimerase